MKSKLLTYFICLIICISPMLFINKSSLSEVGNEIEPMLNLNYTKRDWYLFENEIIFPNDIYNISIVNLDDLSILKIDVSNSTCKNPKTFGKIIYWYSNNNRYFYNRENNSILDVGDNITNIKSFNIFKDNILYLDERESKNNFGDFVHYNFNNNKYKKIKNITLGSNLQSDSNFAVYNTNFSKLTLIYLKSFNIKDEILLNKHPFGSGCGLYEGNLYWLEKLEFENDGKKLEIWQYNISTEKMSNFILNETINYLDVAVYKNLLLWTTRDYDIYLTDLKINKTVQLNYKRLNSTILRGTIKLSSHFVVWEEFADNYNGYTIKYLELSHYDFDNDSIIDFLDEDDDNDGMPDNYELKYGSNPINPLDGQEDLDKDNLTNLEEYIYGTFPKDQDSDNDGLFDGDEIKKYSTNAKKRDTDGDNYNDGIEIQNKTDPLDKNDFPIENISDSEEDNNNNLEKKDNSLLNIIVGISILIILITIVIIWIIFKKNK